MDIAKATLLTQTGHSTHAACSVEIGLDDAAQILRLDREFLDAAGIAAD